MDKKKTVTFRKVSPLLPGQHVDPLLDISLEERCKREARKESDESIKRLAAKYAPRPSSASGP
jgi:hypothetical protein